MRLEEDFILQKAACDEFGLGFLITDFSKGAMPPSEADHYRDERFRRWMPILIAELAFLGNPPIVALGNKAEKYIKKFDVPRKANVQYIGRIYHPSPRANSAFARYYSELKLDSPEKLRDDIPNAEDFKKFARKLMESQSFGLELFDAISRPIFNNERNQHRYRYQYYRDQFEDIKPRVQSMKD